MNLDNWCRLCSIFCTNLSSSPPANLFSCSFLKWSCDQNNFFFLNSRHRAINFFLPIQRVLCLVFALLRWYRIPAWSSIWSKKRVNECVWHLAGCDFFFARIHSFVYDAMIFPKRLHKYFFFVFVINRIKQQQSEGINISRARSQTRQKEHKTRRLLLCNIVSDSKQSCCVQAFILRKRSWEIPVSSCRLLRTLLPFITHFWL